MILRPCSLCRGGLLVLAGFLAGCGPGSPPVADTPPPPVTVSHPILRNVVDQDEFEGWIKATATIDVRARVRGHLIKVNFDAGEMVKKDQLLYEIDPRPYQATLDAAEAQGKAADAAVEFARSEYDRVRQLANKGAAGREEVEVWIAKQAVAKADRLKADANIEQARLDLGFTKITAPIAGKISRTLVDAGNLVNAVGETHLTTIVAVDPVYVVFNVDERSLMRYKRLDAKDAKANGKQPTLKEQKIPVAVGLEGETGFPHVGVITFADNRVNPKTGTIQVRGVLSNANGLFEDGLRARVRVPVSDPYKALLVPERAIGTDQGRKFVYVVNDKDVVESREVTLDRVFDGMQAIKDGLKPEDWVIVNGSQRVREGMKVAPLKKTKDEGQRTKD